MGAPTRVFVLLSIVFFLVPRTISAALSEDDEEILRQGPITSSQYFLGSVLAVVPGFGIGHAVQGRYVRKGWLFSVGETGALFGAVALGKECHNPFTSASGSCTATYAMAGVYVALKLWEMFDAWIAPAHQNAVYDRLKWDLRPDQFRGLIITPAPLSAYNVPGLLVAYHF